MTSVSVSTPMMNLRLNVEFELVETSRNVSPLSKRLPMERSSPAWFMYMKLEEMRSIVPGEGTETGVVSAT